MAGTFASIASVSAGGISGVTSTATVTAAIAQPTTTVTPTTSVTVAGATVNNNVGLPFTGASDRLTSIWAIGLFTAGLALVVVTRQRFAS